MLRNNWPLSVTFDDFERIATPIIRDWFYRLPISSDRFVFDPEDSAALAAKLWDILELGNVEKQLRGSYNLRHGEESET